MLSVDVGRLTGPIPIAISTAAPHLPVIPCKKDTAFYGFKQVCQAHGCSLSFCSCLAHQSTSGPGSAPAFCQCLDKAAHGANFLPRHPGPDKRCTNVALHQSGFLGWMKKPGSFEFILQVFKHPDNILTPGRNRGLIIETVRQRCPIPAGP